MSIQQKTREVILKLKEVKEERGLSLQRILDMVLDNGGNISMSTVRKVFSEGSENFVYRYEDTIKPIADVLLAVPENVPAVFEPDETEAEALRSIIRLKNSMLAEMQAEQERRVAEARSDAQLKIDFLKKEVQRRDELLTERRDFIYQKNNDIAELRKDLRALQRTRSFLIVIVIAFLLLIITALLIDKLNPNIGFFWLDNAAAYFHGAGGLTGAVSGNGVFL